MTLLVSARMIEATDENRAQPLNLSKPQTFELSETVAKDLAFKPGDDIHEVVQGLGGRIRVHDELMCDPAHTGSLFVEGVKDFCIVLPSHTSLARDRFTICHELGHYFLHYLFKFDEEEIKHRKLVAFRKDSERVEWEANWFAAAFLMPERAFRKDFVKFDGNLSRIASKFDVSLRAANIRASDLELT